MRDDAPIPPPARRLAVSIHAMGGQGGGVLAEWITALAEANGFVAQMTSVPGVAQRTGATMYYVEMVPRSADAAMPVLALMPMPGHVDLVIAAELMEAGRAIQRGLVTPARTTLIASTHRNLAVSEKEVPGDGTAEADKVYAAIKVAAKRCLVADFAMLAEANGSIISASLFGAVFASGVLPFTRDAFESAIQRSGMGVAASAKAFTAGADAAIVPDKRLKAAVADPLPMPPVSTGHRVTDALLRRLRTQFPAPTQPMIYAGLRHLTDYQDAAYADGYLDRLASVLASDRTAGGVARDFLLTIEVARHLARALAYDDVIRVADLKIRRARTRRIGVEVAAQAGKDVVQIVEFFHPRMDEVCGLLPARFGAAIEKRPRLVRALDHVVNRGRRVRTDSIWGHLQLACVAGLRRYRRATLRHGREMAHAAAWLERIVAMAPTNYDAAVEIAKCHRLVKGYSDTMTRGLSKFDRVLAGAALVAARSDAADWIRRLRQAALLDEDGLELDGALKTVAALGDAASPEKLHA